MTKIKKSNNMILKLDKNNVPTYKYSTIVNNLTIKGNVIKQNVENKQSKEGEIYAVVIDMREITQGIDMSNYSQITDVVQDLPNSGDMETLMNTIPNVQRQIASALGTGSITLAFSTIVSMLIAQQYNVPVSGNMINIANLSQENMDYILSHVSIDRFALHKIEFLFIMNGMIISMADANDFPDRFKITSDTISTEGSLESILNKRYNTTGITLLHQYSSEAITGELQNVDLPFQVFGKGSLTPFATIRQNNDYEITTDGFSNDLGSFSNVNYVTIRSIVDSSITDPTSNNPGKELVLPFRSNFKLDDEYVFEIRNLCPLPSEVYMYYDENTMANTVTTFNQNMDENNPGIYDQAVIDSNTVVSQGTYLDITDYILENVDEEKNSITVKIYQNNDGYESEREEINSYIKFVYNKIGKSIISYTDPDYKHVGSHNYVIPKDTSTELYINYYNYDNPPVNIISATKSNQVDASGNPLAALEIIGAGLPSGGDGACLLKGTKILMGDGKLKNIEDIQIGEYILDDDCNKQLVVWNQPQNHKKASSYTHYTLPDGNQLDVIGDERILWNGEYKFISSIPEISGTQVNIECEPYEIWTTGKDVIYANGILCAKAYSGIKNNHIRNIARHLYKLLFLHKRDYALINILHDFIGRKILKHKK